MYGEDRFALEASANARKQSRLLFAEVAEELLSDDVAEANISAERGFASRGVVYAEIDLSKKKGEGEKHNPSTGCD